MSIREYVTTTITRETTFPRSASFDTLLFCVLDASFDPGEKFRIYSSDAEAQADSDLGPVSKAMLRAAFAQEQHVPRIIVAPNTKAAGQVTYRLTPVSGALSMGVTLIAPNGTETAITGSDVSNPADALTDFASNLDAVSGIGASVDSGAVVVEVDANNTVWRLKDFVNIASAIDETADLGYDDALSELADEVEFYGVCIDVNSPANIAAVAAWALANERVFYAGPEVLDPADYTATASALKSASNTRVLSLVKLAGKNEYAAAALAAYMRSFEPGSATYAFKSLAGVTADAWSSTQRAAFKTNNVVMYIETAGRSHTSEGYTADGEYLDVIEGIDWIRARQAEGIFALLLQKPKVPYTDEGGALIGNVVRGVLLQAESADRRILEAGSSEVIVPPVETIPAPDRAARHFKTIRWTARLAGAVHYVTVSGAVSV